MPETEGRSLEDIELHFSDKSKKFTDWNIAKSAAVKNADIESNLAKNSDKELEYNENKY